MCGTFRYRIWPQETAQDLLLSYQGDTLTWAPTLIIPPGDYNFKFIGESNLYE